MSHREIHEEDNISFRKLFIPLTTFKSIHIIVFVGFVVYANTFFNSFVWDDLIYILYNQQIHNFQLSNIIGESFFNVGGQYRPIPALYYSLMHSLFKDVPFFYHFFSIGIHILNSILAYLLFTKFLKNSLPLFLSLIFLVHPMQVESVTFISTSGNNLYFTFGLIALLLSMREEMHIKRIIAITCLLVLSYLSKETGILFLFMIFVSRFIYHKKNILKFFYIGILTIIIYSILRFGIGHIYFDKQQLGFIPIYNLSLEQRLINIPAIIFYYLSTFILPIKLTIMHYWVIERISFKEFFVPLFWDLIFFISIITFSIFIHKKTRLVFIFFFIWFCIGLMLHLQIFPLTMTVADRWFYFSMAGLLGILGIIIQFIISTFKQIIKVLLIIGILVLLFLSVRTMVRNINWTDNLTLFSHDSKINENFIIESNLAAIYHQKRNIPEAIKHYERSVQLHPYEASLYNLGILNESLGNKQIAKDYFFRILEIKGRNDNLYSQKLSASAWVLLRKDNISTARDFTRKALVKDPENGFLWMALAVSDYKLGNKDIALKHAKKAKQFSSTEIVNNLYYLIVENKTIPDNMNIILE